MNHQFNLFPKDKPKAKIPISSARIKEVRDAIAAGDARTSLHKMRDLRYHLESIERRISHGKV